MRPGPFNTLFKLHDWVDFGPPGPGWRERLRGGIAAALTLLAAGWLASRSIDGRGLQVLAASMGASAVILFAMPHSPVARPWALVGGHLLSASVGIALAATVPDPWLAGAIAAGLSIVLMHSLRCLHPPGGATALIPVLGDEKIHALGFEFLLTPLALNVAVLLLAALIYTRLIHKPTPATAGARPSPLERLGIQAEDLHAAIGQIDGFVDVSERELGRIYEQAARSALDRRFGELRCGDLITRAPIAVEFGDELEHAWRQLQLEHIHALPVIDRARHVIGIITRSDFFRAADNSSFNGMSSRIRAFIRKTPETNSTKPEVVGQIMSTDMIMVPVSAPISALAEALASGRIHQVPVVDERDKLVGLITQTDLIAALCRGGDWCSGSS